MSASVEHGGHDHESLVFDNEEANLDGERSDESDSEDSEQRWSYYGILMVDRKASTAEINAAYKRLSLQFHPDKHVSPSAQKAAENLFQRIKRARDVLCDEHLRRVYDTLGLKGLAEFENQQLVVKVKDMKSSREFIEDYERFLEAQRFQEEMRSYNPQATTEVCLDMRSVFEEGYYGSDEELEPPRIADEEYEDEDEEVDEEEESIRLWDQIAAIGCSRMKLQQGFSFPIGQKDHIFIDSAMLVNFERSTRGTASLSGVWRRLLPYGLGSRVGLAVGVGGSCQLSWTLSKDITKHSTGTLGVTCDSVQDLLIPGGTCSYSQQLSRRLRSEITGSIGMMEMVRCRLIYRAETYSVVSSVQTGVTFHDSSPSPHSVALHLTKTLPSQHVTCGLRGSISFSNYLLGINFRKAIPSRQMEWNTTLQINSSLGVKLNISLTRGKQKYVLPIHMSSYIQPTAVFYGLLLPTLVYAAARALLIFPYLNKQREIERDKKKEERRIAQEQRRSAAKEEVELMMHAVEQIIAHEESVAGLVIVKALYGCLHTGEQRSEAAEEFVLNVTFALQHQVKDSSLRIPTDVSKSELPGFYDPCWGEGKQLYVRYKFHNKLHHVTLGDKEPISIPKQGHLISNAAGS